MRAKFDRPARPNGAPLKLFEATYLGVEPFMPPLYRLVRKRLKRIAQAAGPRPDFLDVGGRKSHYTIGVPARITITDLARETETQRQLNLGVSREMIDAIRRRRSNVQRILIDDMTRSQLPSASYDCVVAVEVLEHIRDAAAFVQQVRRVLKPGGIFLLTTPNADHPGRQGFSGPDDEHYYTRAQLTRLLSASFDKVEVEYATPVGRFHTLGLQPWTLKHPYRTLRAMAANLVNQFKSASPAVRQRAQGTRHLVAQAQRSLGG
jgi:SAM-dependent methyltransferase